MQIIKSFKDSGLLINDVTQTIENEEKHKKLRFLVCSYVYYVQFYKVICY